MCIVVIPILGILFSLMLIFGRDYIREYLDQQRLKAGKAPHPRNPYWDRANYIVGIIGVVVFAVYLLIIFIISTGANPFPNIR